MGRSRLFNALFLEPTVRAAGAEGGRFMERLVTKTADPKYMTYSSLLTVVTGMDEMQSLKAVLQVLALPVIGQVRLVEDDCGRTEVLTQAFNVTHHAVLSSHGGKLVPEQAKALALLDDQLGRLGRNPPSPICSELVMRTSSDWRRVRMLAREALIHFQWRLELPPQAILKGNVCFNSPGMFH